MLLVVAMMKGDARVLMDILALSGRPYENNLNKAMDTFREGAYDYLVTFDHDNVPKNNPIDLVFLDKDIIGMPYLGMRFNEKRQMEMAFLAMDLKENGEYLDHKVMSGLQEVDAIASGAMVIARRVAEDKDMFFAREWDEKGFATRGVDFNFCKKAKEKGFSVWAHYDYPASHFKEVDLLDLI